MQDVPAYAARTGLAFSCYWDEEPAVLDAAHRARLNHEAWFFCSVAHRERFLAAPAASSGLVTDPVTRRRFRPRPDSPRSVADGVTFLFSSERSRRIFLRDPDARKRPGWGMPGPPDGHEHAPSAGEAPPPTPPS